MKFIINSKRLLERLQVLQGIIATNNSLPILDNFLFDIDNNTLVIYASDLETTIETALEIESQIKEQLAIPSKLLLDILKTFPEQLLTFDIKMGLVEILSSSGKYSLAFSPGIEYPKPIKIEDYSNTEMPPDILMNGISKTLFATSTDDLRPVMCGVLFQLSKDRITFAATDAHKLVKYTRSDISASEEIDFVVPKKPLNILKTILPESKNNVLIKYTEKNAMFELDKYILTYRLVEGKYPNYEAVIPKDNPNKITINRTGFLNALKRVALFSDRLNYQVKLKPHTSEMYISAVDREYSKNAEEKVTCEYIGQDIEIGFNYRFLTETLSNIQSAEVSIEMSLPNRAGIIRPVQSIDNEELLMLVMPSMIT